MSEFINNKEHKQKILKELIMELHNGKSIEEVKPRFEKLIQGVTTAEIAEMEQSLIKEGMPVENVQALCDVHSAVFKGSIEEIHRVNSPLEIPGHPLHTLDMENEALQKFIDNKLNISLSEYKDKDNENNRDVLIEDFRLLLAIDRHYQRKEYLLFPILEKYGITAPPQVMWGVDDEVRSGIKEIIKLLTKNEEKNTVISVIEELINKITEMIYKEKNILFPLTMDHFTEEQWRNIYNESDDVGYFLIEPKNKWVLSGESSEEKNVVKEDVAEGYIKFETGILSFKEINLMFENLPVEVTFIDKDDKVKYFSHGEDRIFTRTKAIIGRTVQNCHPPGSIHVVNKMLEDFRAGKKDHDDFWIKMGDMYVYIRYFALRDKDNEYVGTMEVTQNIKSIRELQGEKRLMS